MHLSHLIDLFIIKLILLQKSHALWITLQPVLVSEQL